MKQRNGSTFNNESGRYETRAPAVPAAASLEEKKTHPIRGLPRLCRDNPPTAASRVPLFFSFFLSHLSQSPIVVPYSKLVSFFLVVRPVFSCLYTCTSCFFVDTLSLFIFTLLFFIFIPFYFIPHYTFYLYPSHL